MSGRLPVKLNVLLIAVLSVLILSGCGDGTVTGEPVEEREFMPQIPYGQKWNLVWSDEFEGTSLDWNMWECPEGPRRDGYWIKEDSYLDGNGSLVLRTKQDGDRYTSGAIRTLGKFEHAFGYWVARCRFHSQVGHWPAFWLYTPAAGQVGEEGGRDGTEIDIMEKAWPAGNDTFNVALHWDGYGEYHQSAGRQIHAPGISEGWHTFGLQWSTEQYVFYVDGKEVWRTAEGGVCQVPVYVKLTEEIGPWAGDIRRATLPDYFYVDYVRVYDLAPE